MINDVGQNMYFLLMENKSTSVLQQIQSKSRGRDLALKLAHIIYYWWMFLKDVVSGWTLHFNIQQFCIVWKWGEGHYFFKREETTIYITTWGRGYIATITIQMWCISTWCRFCSIWDFWEAASNASNDAKGGKWLLSGGNDIFLVFCQFSNQVVDHSRAHTCEKRKYTNVSFEKMNSLVAYNLGKQEYYHKAHIPFKLIKTIYL